MWNRRHRNIGITSFKIAFDECFSNVLTHFISGIGNYERLITLSLLISLQFMENYESDSKFLKILLFLVKSILKFLMIATNFKTWRHWDLEIKLFLQEKISLLVWNPVKNDAKFCWRFQVKPHQRQDLDAVQYLRAVNSLSWHSASLLSNPQ